MTLSQDDYLTADDDYVQIDNNAKINLVLRDFLYKRRLHTTQFLDDVFPSYLVKSIHKDSRYCFISVSFSLSDS